MEKNNEFYGMNPEVEEAEIDDFKCPNCDSTISYSPEDESLHCPSCGFNMKINGEISSEEYDFLKGQQEDSSWNDEAQVVKCENCGACNVIEDGNISLKCPFCGSNHVIKSKELPGIKPHRVVPFKKGADDTKNNYALWLKKKFYVPKKVKKVIPVLELSGVYLPVWTFDTNTYSIYNGRLGKHYTRTIGTGKNRRVVTRVRYFTIRGSKQVKFDDLIVNAGSRIEQNEINKILPFDTNDSLTYDKRYLVGFSAEHYELRLNNGWETAKLTINANIKTAILRQYHYDVISYLNINSIYNDIRFKYVLVPVWIGVYMYNGKTYRFIANGETGKVSGKYPISVLKVTLAIILIATVILGIFIFIATGE